MTSGIFTQVSGGPDLLTVLAEAPRLAAIKWVVGYVDLEHGVLEIYI